MKFDATEDVDPLEFNFAPYADAKGVVPEPSEAQVAAFYVGLSSNMERALGKDRMAGVDPTDPLSMADLLQSLTEEDQAKLGDSLLELHANVCGGEPSREHIAALPFRLRRMFYGAVQGWLRPEGWKPATND